MIKFQREITALALCGIGLDDKCIDIIGNPPLWDHDEKPNLHYTDNLLCWAELDPDGNQLRWGYITKALRVTECKGSFPAITQTVIEFGRFLLPEPHKPEPHPLEVAYSNMRFSFLDGHG